MTLIVENILSEASNLAEGEVIFPKEFLYLGERAAIDQTFSRLAKQGKLIRIGRGKYVLPVEGRFGTRSPSPEKVLQSLAAKTGEVVVSHGAAAANSLGLTTQVPIREVFLTSGANETLIFGNRKVELRHAPRWQLALGNRPAGMALRAIAWLGPEHARKGLEKVFSSLSDEECRALRKSSSILPAWMAKAIGEVAALRSMSHG